MQLLFSESVAETKYSKTLILAWLSLMQGCRDAVYMDVDWYDVVFFGSCLIRWPVMNPLSGLQTSENKEDADTVL